MKMLGNSAKDLLSHQKHLLYLLKKLRKMQQRAVLQILDTFYTLPTLRIKAITGLIFIYLHLYKLSSRHQLRTSALLSNHIIKSLFESRNTNKSHPHYLSLKNITFKQHLKSRVLLQTPTIILMVFFLYSILLIANFLLTSD